MNPACGREAEYELRPAAVPRRVLVVGGGMAGLEAARVAALRGHRVRLLEKTDEVGGHVVEGSAPAFKRDEARLVAWYERQLAAAGVEVVLGHEASPGSPGDESLDVVVLATGSRAKLPGIPGIDGHQVVTAGDVLLDPGKAGDTVVVIGGGLVGCEVAVWLTRQGKTVTVVEVLGELMSAVEVPHPNRLMLNDLLVAEGVAVRTGTSVTAITDAGVRVTGPGGGEDLLAADTVVVAIGYEPVRDGHDAWSAAAPDVLVIGDAAEPRNIMAAIWDAYEVARGI